MSKGGKLVMDPVDGLTAVIRVEWRKHVWPGGDPPGIRLLVAALVSLLLGVALPAVLRRPWMEVPQMIFMWAYIPLFLLGDMVTATFGSERGTEVAKECPNAFASEDVVFFGKLALPVLYALAVFCGTLILGGVTTGLTYAGDWLPPAFSRVGFYVVLCVLLAYEAMAGIAAFFSLQSWGHRAGGWIVRGILIVPLASMVTVLLISGGSPLDTLFSAFVEAGIGQIVFGVVAPLALLDFTSLIIARSAFHRGRHDPM